MNLNRRTFIADAVPHAFGPMSASRTFGGDMDLRPSREETDAVRAESLHELADPETGIIGWGTCMETTTRRTCEYAAKCMGDALAYRPLTCYRREVSVTRQEHRAERTVATTAQIEDILVFMRQHPEPLTFNDVCVALGFGETPLLLSGAWKRMIHTGIIIAVGERMTYGKRHTHHVKTWIIAPEGEL